MVLPRRGPPADQVAQSAIRTHAPAVIPLSRSVGLPVGDPWAVCFAARKTSPLRLRHLIV